MNNPWTCAADAAVTFKLTLARLRWRGAIGHHDGATTLSDVAAKMVSLCVWTKPRGFLRKGTPADWRQLFVSVRLAEWSNWHRHVVVQLASQVTWAQKRFVIRHRLDKTCQLCHTVEGTMHRWASKLPVQPHSEAFRQCLFPVSVATPA